MKYLFLVMFILIAKMNITGFQSPTSHITRLLPPESGELEICCQDCMHICIQTSCLYMPTVCIFCCLGSASYIHKYFTQSNSNLFVNYANPKTPKIE